MSVRNPNYQQVHDLYVLCSNGTSLEEFCRMSGVSYQKYMEWQRNQALTDTFNGTSGSLPPESEQPKDDEGDGVTPKKQNRKKESQKRQPKQLHKVDETITHEVEEYYELPEGARFVYRDGEQDICYYRQKFNLKNLTFC